MAQPEKHTPTEGINLSKSDLIELLKEIRKPIPTQAEINAKALEDASREQMQEMLKQKEANRIQKIKTCSHMRNNGTTTAVYITDFNECYCQACGGWISPFKDPEIFNRIYPLTV